MKKKFSEEEIDRIVLAQADDDSAWDDTVHIHKAKPTALSVPAELAARAAFLARLHRKPDVESWLIHVIRERIELEEVAFVEAKRDLATQGGV